MSTNNFLIIIFSDYFKLQNLSLTFMDNAKAGSTTHLYARDFHHFQTWCVARNLPFLPSCTEVLRLFLTDIAASKDSSSQLSQYKASIQYFHERNFLDASFTQHSSIKLLCEGIRRCYGKPVRKMKPLGESFLKDIYNYYLLPEEKGLRLVSLDIWRSVFMCYLLFHVVGRFSCVQQLLASDITFSSDFSSMSIFLASSKTDQRKSGNFAVVNASGTIFCPVRLARNYLNKLNFISSPVLWSGPLFPMLYKNDSVLGFAPSYSVKITYNVARLQFLSLLPSVGLDPVGYGLHSFRRGAATELHRLGVPETAIAKAGRWACLESVSGYVQYSHEDLRLLSSNLTF